MTKIAFLGAGNMGQGMIRNFLRRGHEVTVYTRTRQKARHLEADGARLARTPRAAATGVDAVFSMLTNDEASRECWTGAEGVFAAALAPGTLVIESSTLSNAWVLELSRLAAAKKLRFLDCPVAGRPDVAAAGQLNVFAGGSAQDLEAVRPLLSAISKKVTHFGPVGTGNAFKLIYNVMGAVHVAALAEGMFACEAAGIDLAAAAEAFSIGATGSPHVVRHSGYMSRGAHEDPVQFSGRGRIKDIGYGVAFIEGIGAQSVIGHAAQAVFGQMDQYDMGNLNDSELIDTLRIAHGRPRSQ
jgi:3-hydroxyisobutyrate dehydrogenase